MLTAIVSDLHLGTRSGADIARRDEVRERMMAALAEADRVVLLGDMLELREASASAVLELAEPFLAALGETCAGKEVVIVPGNHDYELIAPALEEARLDSGGPLGTATAFPAESGALSRAVAGLVKGAEVALAYPGLWLRDDVYATHGHYLDVHLTVPRVECLLASAVARTAGMRRDDVRSPDEHEAALAPIYALAHSLAQRRDERPVTHGNSLSRSIYDRSNGAGPVGFAIGRVGIPAAVAAINATGLGPFRGDISAAELRRAGLLAMGEVVRRTGVEAEHVIFGHTHRAGPLKREVEGWTLPDGAQLHNTGSWLNEDVFLGEVRNARNPYFPGWVTYLRDEGPPDLRNILSG